MADCNLENLSKDELVTISKLKAQSQIHDDTAAIMRKVAETKMEISDEERNVLLAAYENVGTRKMALSSVKEEQNRDKIEEELRQICIDVLTLLHKYLNQSDTHEHTVRKVFYLKMRGDFYRYLSEIADAATRADIVARSKKAYAEATEEACQKMPPTHPLRLGLALSYALFIRDIENLRGQADQHANKAFQDALSQLDELKEEAYMESTEIMEQLKAHITILVDKCLIDTTIDGDAKNAFFYKMRGDFYRYLSEVADSASRADLVGCSKQGYVRATGEACTKLHPTHLLRLAVALSYSLFLNDIEHLRGEASQHANKAFQDAVSELDGLRQDSYMDITPILEQLRAHVQVWESEAY